MIPIYSGEDAEWWLRQRTVSIDAARTTNGGKMIEQRVKEIIDQVRTQGDAAVAAIARRLGDLPPRRVVLDDQAKAELFARVPDEQKKVIDFASSRIKQFAQAVMAALNPVQIDFGEYTAGLDFKPVARAACYVPGGRYPLPSTALMTAITAKVAGVSDICIFSPVLKDEILYAGTIAGATEFYELGGAQAIAAAAFGTATVKAADIIVGPGNAYVTEAKRQIQGTAGIDMLAGPSEIAIIADDGGNPNWLCLDLLSQAEHDPDSRAYLFTDSDTLAQRVAEEMPKAISSINLPEFVAESMPKNAILVLPTLSDCAEAANVIAPEHLQLHVANPEAIKPQLSNYGALFMGYRATVPFGDYVAGPNHTLPTNRAARFCGGLNPLTFLRAQSWINVSAGATELPQEAAAFAKLEGLFGHRAASIARLTS